MSQVLNFPKINERNNIPNKYPSEITLIITCYPFIKAKAEKHSTTSLQLINIKTKFKNRLTFRNVIKHYVGE